MIVASNQSVICPVLIGRTPQLMMLHHLVNLTISGHGQTLLIAGEAGVGKSRLAAEATAAARAQGFRVFEGHCFPPDIASPYAPLRDLLHSGLLESPPLLHAEDLDPAARELVQLLPGLVPVPLDLPPQDPRLDSEARKQRIFAALTHYVTRRAPHQPVLLLIEDLHWSDDTSLEFLHHLTRHCTTQPLLLLLTYRSDEVRPPLRRWLAQLDRERLAQEVALPRLTRDEVAAMLRAIFDLQRPVHAAFLDTIYDLTEGNPFFIEEILKVLQPRPQSPPSTQVGATVAGEDAWDRTPPPRIPRSVHDAVQQRVERLSDAARRVLDLAAVAGRQFDVTLLQALTHLEEPALVAVLKELIAVQLVVEETAERFAFRHALARQAIYTDLLARERKALHRQIAETIEDHHAAALEAHVNDLAYHFSAAEAWEQALVYARRAGEQAHALYAPQTAVEQFTRALEAAKQLAVAPPPALCRERGRAFDMLGDFERAQADYQAALELAQAAADRQAVWQVLLDLGLLWASRDYARAGDYYHQALALARDMGDQATVARSLNSVGNWHMNIDESRAALQAHHEALAMLQVVNDRRGQSQTLDFLGVASYLSGDVVQGTMYLQQAIARFRELDDRQGLVSCLATLAAGGLNCFPWTAVVAMPLAEGLRAGEEALHLAHEIGWRSGEAYAQLCLALSLTAQGTYGQALSLMQSGLEVASEIEHQQWTTIAHIGLGAAYLDLFALQDAQLHLEHALALAATIGSRYWFLVASAYRAAVAILEGDAAQATVLLDATLGRDAAMETFGQRFCWSVRAELAFARAEPDTALHIADELVKAAPHVKTRGEGAIYRLATLRGKALAALHQTDVAEVTLQAALAGALAHGARPVVWQVHAALGALYHTQGRHAEAARATAAAQTLVEELAATIPTDPLRQQFLRSAAPRLARPRLGALHRAAKEAVGGLTPREREVAMLVAQGKSNRAIADGLVVSERTVEDHVGNILGKLGYTSRTQIATWAVETGLIRHPLRNAE